MQVQRTFGRRPGELSGSLSGSAGFTSKRWFLGGTVISVLNKVKAGRRVARVRLPVHLESAKKSGGLAVGVFVQRQKTFGHLDDFLLLAAGQLADLLKDLAELAAGGDHAARFWFAEQVMHGDAECLGHRSQHIGTRNLPAAFPIDDIGV